MPAIYQYGKNFTYGGNVRERTLTQAEYDALSYDEKHDGTTYYITDAPELGTATEESDGLMAADDKATLMLLAATVGEPKPLEEVPFADTVTEAVKTLALTVGEPEVLEEVPYDTVVEAIKEINNEIGETDISKIGNGTITGAISTLSQDNTTAVEDTEETFELLMDTDNIDAIYDEIFGESTTVTT